MKVLLINVNCKYSSTGKIVYALYEQLKQVGHTAAVCYGRGDDIQEEDIYKFGFDWETYFHAGLARITGKNGYYSPFSTRRLIRFIEQFKPDVIHLHELHAYFVNIYPLLDYIKRKKIPVVWTFHCEYMYTGKCGYTYGCNKWQTGCEHCPSLQEYPKSLWLDRSKTMFSDKQKIAKDWPFTIVTPSKWLADKVKKSFLGQKEIDIIHNGIDTKTIFYPREKDLRLLKSITSSKKIILSVAPNIMEERKGGKYVLQLSQQLKDKPYEFVLIGTDETKRYADNVLFIARTKNQDELARWYSLADVFLICSTMENFPTTCLESLSCGTPIIGFDCGGTAETAPESYGHFVPLGDMNGLKNLILQVNTTPQKRQNIRKYACEQYDEKVMTAQYLSLYKSFYPKEAIND